jgi:alcohol dehydrogenase (cytochrome c)
VDTIEAYLHGGASTWITGSYDPELDLMYWGTGNAAPYNPENRKGDNLYAASIIAVRPKDRRNRMALPGRYPTTSTIGTPCGKSFSRTSGRWPMRKVAMQMNRNGFLYVLDRATGTVIGEAVH